MKKLKKVLIILLLLMGISLLFSGCEKRYTNEDRIECAKRKLSNKYGEEFQIIEVFGIENGSFNVYAYSLDHPDVIFKAWYYSMSTNAEYAEYEYDRYIEALVAEQYKDLAKEQVKDLEYDYYIDSWLGSQTTEVPLTDTSITIEEYNAVSAQDKPTPRIEIYFTDKVLKENDEYIYDMLRRISDSLNCNLGVFFITEKDLEMVKTEYETCEKLDGEAVRYLERTYSCGNEWENGKHGYLTFNSEDSELIGQITFEEFKEEMEVIRKDAGY